MVPSDHRNLVLRLLLVQLLAVLTIIPPALCLVPTALEVPRGHLRKAERGEVTPAMGETLLGVGSPQGITENVRHVDQQVSGLMTRYGWDHLTSRS